MRSELALRLSESGWQRVGAIASAGFRQGLLQSFGLRRKYGFHPLFPANKEPARLSRRLKRLRKEELSSTLYGWLDEPYNYLENFYTAGESKKIEQKGYRIQALPKVSRVRGKRRRNR